MSVNVNRRGHSNGLHSHAGNTWSGVYYVASTGRKKDASPWSGRLVFRTSCGGFGARAWAGGEDEVLATDPENKVGWAKYVEADPVPGLMVLFPSWLLHCVLPFEPAAADDHYRISVAFNIGREEEGPEEGAPG